MCERDTSTDALSALPLETGVNEGFLCPRTDQDWYSFTVPPSESIVRLTLATTVTRSPVQPVYNLFRKDASGAAGELVATANAAAAGMALEGVHCVGPGDYFAVVRDSGDDAQDYTNPYRLTITTTTQPDTHEPNEDRAHAVAASAGMAISGAIACVGDQDWYRVDVPAGTVLSVHLEQPTATLQPTVRVFDGDDMQLLSQTNLGGATMPTNISLCKLVPPGRTYYVQVKDDDDKNADPNVPYMLTLDAVPDTDTNEPNNEVTTATAIPEMVCGAAWTEVTRSGTIACAGDVDFYTIPLNGCNGGVLEAEVSFDTSALSAAQQWEFQRKVQAAVGLLRPHGSSPCANDAACRTLNQFCRYDEEHPSAPNFDCEGYFNACLPEEKCAGASLCLPSGVCAANVSQRNYHAREIPMPVSAPPSPNRALISVPIFAGQTNAILRVTDFQSDSGDPSVRYTLRVRVRSDQDAYDRANPPNNLYTNELPETMEGLPVQQSIMRAASVPVHRCTSGDCCSSGTWITGRISYENDFDWYTYAHPCPGTDCMVRINYQVDGGPVNILTNLYHGSSQWYDSEWDSGSNGSFGGLGGSDRCLYAYRGHTTPYYLLIRDKTDDGPNWSADQSYRFCVEMIADTCQAPCMDYGPERGYCGPPS